MEGRKVWPGFLHITPVFVESVKTYLEGSARKSTDSYAWPTWEKKTPKRSVSSQHLLMLPAATTAAGVHVLNTPFPCFDRCCSPLHATSSNPWRASSETNNINREHKATQGPHTFGTYGARGACSDWKRGIHLFQMEGWNCARNTFLPKHWLHCVRRRTCELLMIQQREK